MSTFPKLKCCDGYNISSQLHRVEKGIIEEECMCRKCAATWRNVFTFSRTLEFNVPGQMKYGSAADHIDPNIAEDK